MHSVRSIDLKYQLTSLAYIVLLYQHILFVLQQVTILRKVPCLTIVYNHVRESLLSDRQINDLTNNCVIA